MTKTSNDLPNLLSRISYIMSAFAFITDGEISEEEENKVIQLTMELGKEWEYSPDEIIEAVSISTEVRDSCKTIEEAHAIYIEALNDLELQVGFDIEEKKRLVTFLEKIMNTDGEQHKNELFWINKIKEIWKIEDEVIDSFEGIMESMQEDVDKTNKEITLDMLGEGFTGSGSFTTPDGTIYVGEFKEGRFHGQGTYTYTDGENYVGDFKEGNMNGTGTYTFATGDKYIGEFIDGLKNGQGVYMHGKGDWEGDVYEGEWKDDERNGSGILTVGKGEFEGDVYAGEFKNGERHGKGKYICSDGSSINGEWVNGELETDKDGGMRVDTLDALDFLNFHVIGEYLLNNDGEVSVSKSVDNLSERNRLVYLFIVENKIMYVGATIRGYKRPLRYHSNINKNSKLRKVHSGIKDVLNLGKKVQVYARIFENIVMEFEGIKLNPFLAYEEALIEKFDPDWNEEK